MLSLSALEFVEKYSRSHDQKSFILIVVLILYINTSAAYLRI